MHSVEYRGSYFYFSASQSHSETVFFPLAVMAVRGLNKWYLKILYLSSDIGCMTKTVRE